MDWSQLSFQVPMIAAPPPMDDSGFRIQALPPPAVDSVHHDSHYTAILHENGRLKTQLENTQRQLNERDAQIFALQKRIAELSSLPAVEEPRKEACPTLPVYGRRDNPLVTETGLFDGRSNADMAFDQKCQLLEEFRREYGHLNVRLTDPERFIPLVSFIVKQRKYYRAFRSGELTSVVNLDRIRRLEELGFEWSRRPDYEAEFCKMFDQLVAFKKIYGHCCVNAIPDTDPELVKFVSRQRKYIRDTKKLERQQYLPSNHGEAKQCGQDCDTTSGDEAEHFTDPIDLSEDVEDEAKSVAKQKQQKYTLIIPKHYVKSMQTRIESLDDLFLTLDPNKIAPIADKVAQYCRTVKFLKQTRSYHPNSISWYQRFEEFRAFYTSHGHGLVPLNCVKSVGLKAFVRLERALYQAIQQRTIESHPVLEKNIQFLKDHGFVYDEVAIKNEEARLQALEVKKRRDELYFATPRGQLELMEKDAEEAKLRLHAAREAKKAAEEALSEAHKYYLAFQKKIREAEEKASKDPVGSIVHVRDRGPGKPGGEAKVTRYFVTKVLNEVVKFYDVVYLDDEREDYCIEGRFIDDAKTVSALLDLRKTVEDKKQDGVLKRNNKRKSIQDIPTPAPTDHDDDKTDSKQLKMSDPMYPTAHMERMNSFYGQNNATTKHATSESRRKRIIELSIPSNDEMILSRLDEQTKVDPVVGLEPSTSEGVHSKSFKGYRGTKKSKEVPKKTPETENMTTRTIKSKNEASKNEAPIKPKHPVGSLVTVRWRGEQKTGGVGIVTNFFTTKVLSEILPFYEVEYLKDKARDSCIEGRFVEEYKNPESFDTDNVNHNAESQNHFVMEQGDI